MSLSCGKYGDAKALGEKSYKCAESLSAGKVLQVYRNRVRILVDDLLFAVDVYGSRRSDFSSCGWTILSYSSKEVVSREQEVVLSFFWLYQVTRREDFWRRFDLSLRLAVLLLKYYYGSGSSTCFYQQFRTSFVCEYPP